MQNAQEIVQKAAEVNIWWEIGKIVIPSLVTVGIGFWLSKKTESYKRDLLIEVEDYKKDLSKELEAHKHSLLESAETRKIRREKLEELHNLLTLYFVNINSFMIGFSYLKKNDTTGFDPLSELLINPLPKINTVLMMYVPILKPYLIEFVDSANSLRDCALELMKKDTDFEELIEKNNLLKENCRALIRQVEGISHKDKNLVKTS